MPDEIDVALNFPPQRSYLTVREFLDAPTAVDTTAMAPGEIANVISRASGMVDRICHQILAPSADTEIRVVRSGMRGQLYVQTRQFPIVRITALSCAEDPRLGYTDLLNPTPIALTILRRAFWAWAQLLPRTTYFVELTYENGYTNTTLSLASVANATSITTVDTQGVYPGQVMTVIDGVQTEQITVAPAYVAGVTPITLVAGMTYAHAKGVAVSAMPFAVKQAAISLTAYLIKQRGAGAVALSDLAGEPRLVNEHNPHESRASQEYLDAVEMLKPYTVREIAP